MERVDGSEGCGDERVISEGDVLGDEVFLELLDELEVVAEVFELGVFGQSLQQRQVGHQAADLVLRDGLADLLQRDAAVLAPDNELRDHRVVPDADLAAQHHARVDAHVRRLAVVVDRASAREESERVF